MWRPLKHYSVNPLTPSFMTRIVLTTAFLAATLVASAAPKTLSYKTDVVVDGQYTEWTSPLPMTNKRTGLNFDVANDDRHLYLFLRVTDKAVQRQIVSNGFELWINADGKKKKTTGITYPLPLEDEPATTTQAPAGGSTPAATTRGTNAGPQGNRGSRGGSGRNPWDMFGNQNEDADRFVISRDMILQGFLIENGQQPAKGSEIKTAITLDYDGAMLYEIAIPFNTFLKERLDSDDIKRTFAICFLVKKPSSDSPTGQMMRMGRSMGYMGPAMGPMGVSVEERRFWLKVKPAIQ